MLPTPLDHLLRSIARLDIYHALKEEPRMQNRFWTATSSQDADFEIIEPKTKPKPENLDETEQSTKT
jgi:hypothetical protein